MNANITWISIKVGYWSKEMPENYTRRKEQLNVSPKRLKKKYRAWGPVSEQKEISPGWCAGNKFMFVFGLKQEFVMTIDNSMPKMCICNPGSFQMVA